MPKLTYTTPPPSLMIELHEVAVDAGALASEIARANQLPSNFPTEQLQELLMQLQLLPDGTAEGCRHPLEYARSRLPAIRRTFIQTEERSRVPCANNDLLPPLTRGMVIDQHIGALISSVLTALDEYRALASLELDDTADTAPSFEIDATTPDVIEAMAASATAEKNLGQAAKQVEDIADTASVTADNLKRQMRDARSLLILARIELRMPGFVPRWYRNTIDTVKDYPKLLRRTARAIQIGVDVARPLADAWSHFTHGFKRLILDSVEHAARGLDSVGKKWEAEQSAAREASNPDAPPPDFDFNLAREMISAGSTLKPSWRPWIHELNFSERTLNDLAPLLGLTQLRSLDLGASEADNFWPLAGLAALEKLCLSNVRIKNLAPLAGLTSLKSLDLDNTEVNDLRPLSHLTALEALWLNNTAVSDLSPLAGLTKLQELYLDNTAVQDLTPLANLRSLRVLWVESTEVDDLDPLKNLSGLAELWLGNTSVSDLGPLAALASLGSLYIDGTQVIDLRPLAGLTSLVTLSLERTDISDLEPLAQLKELTRIHVETKKRKEALAKTLRVRSEIIIARDAHRPLR
jgi:hypothetical protein